MKTLEKSGFYKIIIDYSQCGNCGACIAVCPEDVLHLNPVMLVSDDDKCTGCNRCIITCPSDVLKLSEGDDEE